MPKCPVCGLEIDHIICETSEFHRSIVRLIKDDKEKGEIGYDPDIGLMEYDPGTSLRWEVIEDSNTDEDEYICPMCRKEIAQNEVEVVKFLKGS